jgi:hypothetical protein
MGGPVLVGEPERKRPLGRIGRRLVKKVKVKLFLRFFLAEHHAMKAYWRVEA